MSRTLGATQGCPAHLPLAMLMAVEPAFKTIAPERLRTDLRYNPLLQVNDDSRFGVPIAGHTSTSIRSSTGFPGFSDQDSKGDESS